MHFFDDLARSAANGLSRRQALGRLGGLFGASLLGVLGFGKTVRASGTSGAGGSSPPTASDCAHYCNQLSTPRNGCENVCKACSDISKMCGTTGADQVCCNGACCSGQCTDLNTDVQNCGTCGTVCGGGMGGGGGGNNFGGGGQSCCGGCCTDLQTDNCNCGACGTVCDAGQTCSGGVCGGGPTTGS